MSVLPVPLSSVDAHPSPPRRRPPPSLIVRRVEAVIVIGVLLASTVWSASAIAIEAWRGFPPWGSSEWSDADWNLWEEIDELRGPHQEVLAHVEEMLGPDFALPQAPVEADITAVWLRIRHRPVMDPATDGYLWTSIVNLVTAAPTKSSFEDLTAHFGRHFDDVEVQGPRTHVHSTTTLTEGLLGLKRSVTVHNSVIAFEWDFALEEHGLVDSVSERFAGWGLPSGSLEDGWYIDSLRLWFEPDGWLHASTELERSEPSDRVDRVDVLDGRRGLRQRPVRVLAVSLVISTVLAVRRLRKRSRRRTRVRAQRGGRETDLTARVE